MVYNYLESYHNIIISGLEAATLELWMVTDLAGRHHFIAQTYLGKSPKGIRVYAELFRNGREKISLWGIYVPQLQRDG